MLSTAMSDIRHAARRTTASPGFALAAIMTVALGVGLATGGFSIVSGLLLRDLPVPESNELVHISRLRVSTEAGAAFPNPVFSIDEYEAFRDRTRTLASIAGHSIGSGIDAILDNSEQQDLLGTAVSCNYFDVLRQPPTIGRGLITTDCNPGAPPVIVLGRDLWQSTFDGDPAVVGRSVVLGLPGAAGWERRTFTVVGIGAEDTYNSGGARSAFFAPYRAIPTERPVQLRLIGRRNDATSLDEIGAELGVIANDLEASRADSESLGTSLSISVQVERARPFAMSNTDAIASAIGFMVPFGLILLIVCANVANLMLVRATDRNREIALRLSLGASRGRVVRLLLTESVFLATAGGALGTVIAFASFDALFALVMSYVPDPRERLLVDLAIDFRVLIFALLLSLVTGILCGLSPAIKLTRLDLNTAMKPNSTGAGGRPGGIMQSTFVGVQVAVCIVLMAVSGLFLRDFYVTNAGVDPGFDYDSVAVARVLRSAGDAAVPNDFENRLTDEIRALPGVQSVAWSSYVPWGDAPELSVGLQGESPIWVNSLTVSRDYFEVQGTPIVRGRTFSQAELEQGSSTVAIVSESMARILWGERDPLGETLLVSEQSSQPDSERAPLEVVGVSRDAEIERVGEITVTVHQPTSGRIGRDLLMVRSQGNSASLEAAIRATIRESRPGLDARVWSLHDSFALLRYQSGFSAALTLSVGALAMILVAIGISGVVAYLVGRQKREIGIRLALGAQSQNVLYAILRRSMRPVFVGSVIGTILALGVAQLLREPLIVIGPFDPVGLGGAVAFVLIVGLLASIVPARRGLRVDPMTTLRYE